MSKPIRKLKPNPKVPNKISLYHYISYENKKFLMDHAGKRGISESKMLDFILDHYRTGNAKLQIAV